MSFPKKNQVLPEKINDEILAGFVSEQLRKAHENDTSAIKRIAARTGVSTFTIAKWYQGKNAPKGIHLLRLAANYPSIFEAILQFIDPECFCIEVSNNHRVYKVCIRTRYDGVYWDNFVHLDLSLPMDVICKLNVRQIWFLSELNSGKNISTLDLAAKWGKSHKSAARDISQLVQLELVLFVGSKKTGRYVRL